MTNDDRDVVMIYGNCQAQFLGTLVNAIPSLAGRFVFYVVSDTLEPDEQAQRIPPEAKRAVLVWEQYDQRPELAQRDALLECVPADCAVVRYPPIAMNAFWPLRVKDPRNRPEPGYPWGRFPQGDRVAVEMASLGLRGARAFERYMKLSSAAMPDIERMLAVDRMSYARRDAACDVTMGDFVFANLTHAYQFWTHGHLSAFVMSELVGRLFESSGSVLGDPSESTRGELEAALARFPGQGPLQLPLHPLVIETFDLTFVDTSTRYRWFDNAWTFEEYMTRYLSFDCDW
ncbi:MAG TPA: WcbI family polysaccharide biosynthesis putative acetyltransferase [Candidatus Baltobacteraceae bacterium]